MEGGKDLLDTHLRSLLRERGSLRFGWEISVCPGFERGTQASYRRVSRHARYGRFAFLRRLQSSSHADDESFLYNRAWYANVNEDV